MYLFTASHEENQIPVSFYTPPFFNVRIINQDWKHIDNNQLLYVHINSTCK
jgi:hypothetical protein